MNIEEFREYCIAKPFVTEGFPFDEKTLVFKVAGKMFALTGVDSFNFINLKCDPERAIDLRETFSGITAGYHMSKKHWNSVATQQGIPNKLIFELIDHSYDLVFNSLTKKVRDGLQS